MRRREDDIKLNIKETVCEDTNGKKLNKSGGFL
jgi:hypothetical protein